MQEKKESILTGILAITGRSGLFKTVSQGGAGLIIESLTDGKRSLANNSAQVVSLADVSIYGEEDEVSLEDIFKKILKMENKAKTSVSHKASGEELNDYFSDVFPEYDKDRVYPSDIKKVIRWYNLLLDKGLLEFEVAEKNNTEEKEE